MNAKKLMDAMEYIDDGLILEAAQPKKRAPNAVWLRYTAAAACLCIVCFAAIMAMLPASRTEPDVPPVPTEIVPVTDKTEPPDTEMPTDPADTKPDNTDETSPNKPETTEDPKDPTGTTDPTVTVYPDTGRTEPQSPDTASPVTPPEKTDPPVVTDKNTDTSVPQDTSVPPDTSDPTDTSVPQDTSDPTETSDPTDTSVPQDTSDPADTSEPEDTSKADDPAILPEPEQLYDPSVPAEEYEMVDPILYGAPAGMPVYPQLLYLNGGDYSYSSRIICSNCSAPGFHDYGWLYQYFFPELSFGEAQKTKDLPDPDDPFCPLPNVASFVRQNGITREMLEKAQNECYYLAWNNINVDAVYGGYDALHEWIGSDDIEWETEYDRRSFIKEYKINLARMITSLPEYESSIDRYFYPQNTLPEIENLAAVIKTDEGVGEDARLRLGIKYFHEYLYASKYYDIADTFSIARIIKDAGITREHAELLYRMMYGGGEGRVKIDFDALYADLDYYADVAGKPGCEYVWQADALLIK